MLVVSSYWRPTVLRGLNEQSAKPTRPTGSIGQLKVMTKSEIIAM